MRTGRGPGPPKGQTDAAETSAQERVQAGITELLAVFTTLKVCPMHEPWISTLASASHLQRQGLSIKHPPHVLSALLQALAEPAGHVLLI